MNTYFDQNEGFNSNKRIFEAYYQEARKPAGKLQRALDALLSSLSSLAKTETRAKVIRLAKACGVAVSLIGFVGVIGAMERGTLGLGSGLLIGALLIGAEYLCLRGRRQDRG
ncbi:MAG: hypothetical protein IKJ35_00635 [Clostridia bacterium]|nr:hypothetical protein [Clostridia bacterium]